MSAFRKHFLDKYFGYRSRYVAHIVREAPARGSLAVLSEIARLGFMIAGNVLCGAILWVLTLDAAGRDAGIGPWPVLFGACALVPTVFIALSIRGLAQAVRARRQVAALTRASAGDRASLDGLASDSR